MSTVHVCPVKDIVCGDRPYGWCASCPKLSASTQVSDKTLPLDRAVDWYFDGKPITYRDCIRNQCGPVALSYAERIQELALAANREEPYSLYVARSAIEAALNSTPDHVSVPYAYTEPQADNDVVMIFRKKEKA
jgi:hypothetical protein